MSDFKQILEENTEREKYRSRNRKFFFIFLTVFIYIFITMFFGNTNGILLQAFVFIPKKLMFLELFILLLLFFIINGVPKWFYLKKAVSFINKFDFVDIKFLKIMEKGGLKRELKTFFYPEVTMTDGVPRSQSFEYFTSKKYSPDNLFDFGVFTAKSGTKRVIKLFRNPKREKLVQKIETSKNRKKIHLEAKKELIEYDKIYTNKVANEQSKLYLDLLQMLQGIYESYETDFGEKLEINSKLCTPLDIFFKRDTTTIGKVEVNNDIDVITEGRVNFSIDMIMDTVKNLNLLYMTALKHRAGRGRFNSVSKKDFISFETYFKFFMTRKILKNYSNIPSGWICVKMEDYTARAIASNIDREMIISIVDGQNDGKNSSYSSDVEASKFLFTYWFFTSIEPTMIKVMEQLEFIFNATKEVNEITARKFALKEENRLKAEIEAQYNNMNDKDLVYLDELLKDDENVIKNREKQKKKETNEKLYN